MSVTVQSFLLCDSVVIDAHSGKTTIQGVFDRLFALQYPATHPSCTLYVRLAADRKEGAPAVSMVVQRPSGAQEQPVPTQTLVVGEDGIAQAIINVQGLPLPEAGIYTFVLVVDGSMVAEFKLAAMTMSAPNVSSVPESRLH